MPKQTHSQLATLYRQAASAIMRKLDARGQMQKQWPDGRKTADVIAEFIKPNDRLTSFERLDAWIRTAVQTDPERP